MKKTFIGVDFSKETIDVVILNSSNLTELGHGKFENSEQGCKEMLKWIRTLVKSSSKTWLFCGEHTGIYSLTTATFLTKKGIDIWIESALQIKESQGIIREKNDKIDAGNIALYAYRFQDKARVYCLPSKTLAALKDLMAYRERLKTVIRSFSVSSNELKRVKNMDNTTEYIFNNSQSHVGGLKKDLKAVEAKILTLIQEDEELKKNYTVVESIKGIGMVNAVTVLISTNNFTSFTDPRKFSCYCGSAPFQQQSGTSLKSNFHVSKLANKGLKTYLTQAAESAMQYNPVLKAYAKRKQAEGKAHYLVVNNVRNKLIHLIFALVKTGQTYEMNYSHKLIQFA